VSARGAAPAPRARRAGEQQLASTRSLGLELSSVASAAKPPQSQAWPRIRGGQSPQTWVVPTLSMRDFLPKHSRGGL
jgi:hypothetical protein